MQREMAGADWGMLLGLALAFGSAFFFIRIGLESFGPLTVSAGRVAVAGLALGAYAGLRGRRWPAQPATWLALLVMGALNNALPFALICWGQTRIDSGLAAILNATTPIFSVLLGHLAGTERLTPRRLLGVALGFAGVATMIGPAALRRFDPTDLAALAVLAAACSYACAGLWGRRLRHLPPEIAAAGMLAGSSLLLLPAAVLLERPWRGAAGIDSLAAVAALALLGTAVAYLLYFRLLARVGPTNLLLVTFLLPVVALALGATFLGERLQPVEILGFGLILAGLAAIDGRLFAARAEPTATSLRAAGTSGSPPDCRRS